MSLTHFQQSDFWTDFKCGHGWNKVSCDGINVLVRSFKKAFFKFSLAYVPMAPAFLVDEEAGFAEKAEADINYVKALGELSSKVKGLLPKDTAFIRFDIPLDFADTITRDGWISNLAQVSAYAKVPLVKSDVDVQPPDSVLLDLSLSEDEQLEQMKSKWRYNIRYAAKHGVTVRAVHASSPDFEDDLDSFYKIYQTTAKRDGIGLHPKEYYKDLLERGDKGKCDTEITLYIASHEGEDLACIITLFNKDEAVYLYGCSSNSKRNLMPAYLVQWTAICDAKKYGCKVYDFYGIPPTGEEGHPMHGLYLFKTGFGGREIHRPGCFDIPLKTLVYKLYIQAERVRAFLRKKIIKKLLGR